MQAFQALLDQFLVDARLLKVSALTGGISAQTSRLEVLLSDGTIHQFVVRQHGERDRAINPRIAFDEFKLLQHLYDSALPTAKPYHVDDTIFAVPCIVLEYIEGETRFAEDKLADCIRQMAATLAKIHSIANPGECFNFLPPQALRYNDRLKNRPLQLDVSLSEDFIRDVLEPVWELPHINEHTLLHGDYWAGNIVWRDDKLIAVIDWEDAMLGDPLADLGDIRIAILWSFGREVMQLFTEQYQTLMSHLDYRYLPYWDLCAALRPISQFSNWANDAEHEAMMRAEHCWFVNQALARLP